MMSRLRRSLFIVISTLVVLMVGGVDVRAVQTDPDSAIDVAAVVPLEADLQAISDAVGAEVGYSNSEIINAPDVRVTRISFGLYGEDLLNQAVPALGDGGWDGAFHAMVQWEDEQNGSSTFIGYEYIVDAFRDEDDAAHIFDGWVPDPDTYLAADDPVGEHQRLLRSADDVFGDNDNALFLAARIGPLIVMVQSGRGAEAPLTTEPILAIAGVLEARMSEVLADGGPGLSRQVVAITTPGAFGPEIDAGHYLRIDGDTIEDSAFGEEQRAIIDALLAGTSSRFAVDRTVIEFPDELFSTDIAFFGDPREYFSLYLGRLPQFSAVALASLPLAIKPLIRPDATFALTPIMVDGADETIAFTVSVPDVGNGDGGLAVLAARAGRDLVVILADVEEDGDPIELLTPLLTAQVECLAKPVCDETFTLPAPYGDE